MTGSIPAACPICISVGWRDGRFRTHASLYERGSALLGSCWRCGHTILLAALTHQEITDRGPELLAAAAVPDPRCAAGNHDEITAAEGLFTYVAGVRVPAEGSSQAEHDAAGPGRDRKSSEHHLLQPGETKAMNPTRPAHALARTAQRALRRLCSHPGYTITNTTQNAGPPVPRRAPGTIGP
jgi:hypothetical protein